MPELADKLEAARAEVARLERIAATATCRELGCDMQSIGGANCGCEFEDRQDGVKVVTTGCCSVPVNVCTRCGDCDYGDNEDAKEARRSCREAMCIHGVSLLSICATCEIDYGEDVRASAVIATVNGVTYARLATGEIVTRAR